MAPWLIAGLGNPGPKYAGTRHNAGFDFIDALASAWNLSWSHEKAFEADIASGIAHGDKVLLVKPLTFMNLSGKSVSAAMRFHKIPLERVLVVHDEVAFAPGASKLNRGGSAAGHNGVADIIRVVGPGFLRLRIGIGPKAHPQMDLVDHVLGKLPDTDRASILASHPALIAGLATLLTQGESKAMNQLNRKPSPSINSTQP